MEIIFSNKAKSDLLFWQKSGNKIILKKDFAAYSFHPN